MAAIVAVGLAFRHHQKRSGGGAAAALLALLILASGCLIEILNPEGALGLWAAAACVAAALFVTYDHEPFPGGRPAEIYPDTKNIAFPFVSIVLILVSLRWSPLCLVFVAPIIAAVPRARRKGPLALAVVGLGVVATLTLVLPNGEVGWPEAESILHRFDPALLGWNLTYLVAGKNVGVLVWYLPALLLVACYRPGTNRGWLLTAVAAGSLALPLLAPHDFLGGPEAITNRSLLPFYAALWFVPGRVPKVGWLVLTAVGAGLFLWPAWLSPAATAAGTDRPSFHRLSLASRLPYETTQEHAPAFAEWQGTGVLSRSLASVLRDGDDGPVFAASSGPAELMIAAERPLESVLIDFGPRAGSELRVVGGVAGNTVFRPDGGVRFEIDLEGPSRKHPIWVGDRRHYVYLFRIEMPNPPERPLPVAIMARPADALPRSLDPASLGADG